MFALPGAGVSDSLEQQVHLATFDTVRRVAGEGPCVIIGRCADYALEGRDNVLSLFIHGCGRGYRRKRQHCGSVL